GEVAHVTEVRPRLELAQRLDLKKFYHCQCQVAGRPFIVYATEVPWRWPLDTPIREPMSLHGVYFKLSGGGAGGPGTPTFAAVRIAWHPAGLLGRLGLDVGLLDGVAHNQELISQNDQEAFYQLLAGASGLSAGEIDRAA